MGTEVGVAVCYNKEPLYEIGGSFVNIMVSTCARTRCGPRRQLIEQAMGK